MKLPMLHDICIIRDTVKCAIEFYQIFSFLFFHNFYERLLCLVYIYTGCECNDIEQYLL